MDTAPVEILSIMPYNDVWMIAEGKTTTRVHKLGAEIQTPFFSDAK